VVIGLLRVAATLETTTGRLLLAHYEFIAVRLLMYLKGLDALCSSHPFYRCEVSIVADFFKGQVRAYLITFWYDSRNIRIWRDCFLAIYA